jgi:hypothetical protein
MEELILIGFGEAFSWIRTPLLRLKRLESECSYHAGRKTFSEAAIVKSTLFIKLPPVGVGACRSRHPNGFSCPYERQNV